MAAVGSGARKRLIQNFKPAFVVPGGSGNGNSGASAGAAGSGDSNSQLGSGSSSLVGAAGKTGAGGLGLSGLGGVGGKGSANSGGSNPPPATQKTEFDDTANKNQSGRPPSAGNGSGRPPSAGNGPGAGVQQSKAFDKFYPMCLFMDGDAVTSQQGNATIKGMVDNMAQACGVNLVVFPVTVKPGSYDNSPGAADVNNNLQKAACNIVPNIPNVTNASTSFCQSSDAMADHMCASFENDPKKADPRHGRKYKMDLPVAGCAQVNSKTGSQDFDDFKQKLRDIESGKIKNDPDFPSPGDATARLKELQDDGSSGGGGRSDIAPSIEDVNSCTSMIVAHEAIGHSMMGMPNGDGHGNGIGLKKAAGMNEGWTPEGCAVIQKNAMVNDGTWRWEQGRQTYYVPPADRNNWWDLGSGRKLFNPPANAPGGGPVMRPPIVQNGGNTVVMDDGAAKGSGDAGSGKATAKGSGQLAATIPDVIDPRHRLVPRPAGGDAVGGTRPGGSPIAGASDEVNFPEKPKLSPPNNKPVGTKSVGFDDDVAKSSGGGGGSSFGKITKSNVDAMPGEPSFGSPRGVDGGGAGGAGGFAFQDDAAKGEASGSASGRAGGGGPSGTRGGGYAFDEGASKSASGGVGSTVGMVPSGDRSPASLGGSILGTGSSVGGRPSGFSGKEFFGNVGRDEAGTSADEVDEQLRQRRRRKDMRDRIRGIDGEVSRRGRGGRTPSTIPGSGEAP